jgi:predicted kinase
MPVHVAVLVVVGGLPATGKSTTAEHLARHIRALTRGPNRAGDRRHLATSHPVGIAGYAVAYALAAERLGLGLAVVLECVNPVAVTRDSWVETATAACAPIVEVETVCSDAVEHRRRVESRLTDVAGLVKPTWPQVVARGYEPWRRPHIVIDTALTSVKDAVELIAAEVLARRRL